MITGDNPLTACHVARELRFTRCKSTLILTASRDKVALDDDPCCSWEWRSVDESNSLALDESEGACADLTRRFDLCVTGEGLAYLQASVALVRY